MLKGALFATKQVISRQPRRAAASRLVGSALRAAALAAPLLLLSLRASGSAQLRMRTPPAPLHECLRTTVRLVCCCRVQDGRRQPRPPERCYDITSSRARMPAGDADHPARWPVASIPSHRRGPTLHIDAPHVALVWRHSTSPIPSARCHNSLEGDEALCFFVALASFAAAGNLQLPCSPMIPHRQRHHHRGHWYATILHCQIDLHGIYCSAASQRAGHTAHTPSTHLPNRALHYRTRCSKLTAAAAPGIV